MLLLRAGDGQRSGLVQWYHIAFVWWEDREQGGPPRGDTLTAGRVMGQGVMELRETTGQLLEGYLQFPSDNFADWMGN